MGEKRLSVYLPQKNKWSRKWTIVGLVVLWGPIDWNVQKATGLNEKKKDQATKLHSVCQLRCRIQNAQTFFSIWLLLSLEKYARQKYSVWMFPIFFNFVCFPPFLQKKWLVFASKPRILAGKRNKLIVFFNWKLWIFQMPFHLVVVL